MNRLIHIILLLAFSNLFLKAQHGNIISISLSNNGLIQEQLSRFYLPFPKTIFFNKNLLVTNNQEKKINFSYERAITTNNYIGVTFAIGNWDGNSAQNNGERIEEYRQTFYQYSITYNHAFRLNNKFFLIPESAFTFFSINDFSASTKPTYLFGKKNYLDKFVSSGGEIYGTNFNTKLRYNILENFFVTTALNVGLLYYDIGGETHLLTTSFVNNEPIINTLIYDKTLNKITFSNPELFIGLGVSF